MKKSFFLIIWNIVIVLIGLEFLVSRCISAPMFYNIGLVKTNDLGIYELSSNRDLIYVPRPNTGEFNADGYRGKLYPLAKIDKKRILLMGDSVSDGLKVSAEKRYTELLNSRPGAGYEIINLSVCGYNFLQEAAYLKEKGLKYKPDYVFFAMTENDFDVASGQLYELNDLLRKIKNGGFYFFYYNTTHQLEKILLKSSLYRCLKYVLFARRGRGSLSNMKISNSLNTSQAKAILGEINKMSNAYKFKVFFLFMPFRDPAWQFQRLKSFFISEGVNYFDIDQIVHARYSNDFVKSLFPFDIEHMNEKGHECTAEILQERIDSIIQQPS